MQDAAPQTIQNIKLDIILCPYCKCKEIASLSQDKLSCKNCSTEFPVFKGMLNMMPKPNSETLRELKGMAVEANEEHLPVEQIIFRYREKLPSYEEKIQHIESEARNYYRSNEMNVTHVIERLTISPGQSILEIGSDTPFRFLNMFRERGCRCVAANIYFDYDNQDTVIDWPERVVGDMNLLPFRDETFDFVLMSATAHHSPDIETSAKEAARILKPGGTMLVLNEPTGGWIKNLPALFDRRFARGKDRDELIHENEYTIFRFKNSFKDAGFQILDSFFSTYYDHKLQTAAVKGIRFAFLAGTVSRLWKIEGVRKFLMKTMLLPGQVVLGLEMNLILKKPG